MEATLCMITWREHEEEQEKHLLRSCWVSSNYGCTTAPYSSPSPFYTPRQWLPKRRYESRKERGVTALYKLKELATAKPALGAGDVLVMRHVCSCPFLRCSKWHFLQDPDACNADVSIWLTCLCCRNSQPKDLSSPICTIVLLLKDIEMQSVLLGCTSTYLIPVIIKFFKAAQ